MRSVNRAHERDRFFKYVSADTAIKILSSCCMRWSSPVRFNDPFDVPKEVVFGVTEAELSSALTRRVAALIAAPPADTSHLAPHLRLLIDTVKMGIPAPLKDEMVADLLHGDDSSLSTGALDALRAAWRDILPRLRILCLAESPMHLAMWYHYADRYRGAVVELRCTDELESGWLLARPVRYATEKPAVYTADGLAGLVTLRNDLATKTFVEVATYTKAPDWSYESEWRITSMAMPEESGLVTDFGFHPRDLGGLYFGPMMDAVHREQLIALLAGYPSADAWQVSLGMDRELRVSRIDG